MMSPSDDRIREIKASVQYLRAALRDAHGNMETTSRQFADWRSDLMSLIGAAAARGSTVATPDGQKPSESPGWVIGNGVTTERQARSQWRARSGTTEARGRLRSRGTRRIDGGN